MTQTLLKITHSTFQVESPKGLVEVKNVQKGNWTKYEVGTEELYLHDQLSIVVATKLSLWEELNNNVKITINDKDKVIGFAVRKGVD